VRASPCPFCSRPITHSAAQHSRRFEAQGSRVAQDDQLINSTADINHKHGCRAARVGNTATGEQARTSQSPSALAAIGAVAIGTGQPGAIEHSRERLQGNSQRFAARADLAGQLQLLHSVQREGVHRHPAQQTKGTPVNEAEVSKGSTDFEAGCSL
jgi:hypothetical protein